jgi:hypothetical protein
MDNALQESHEGVVFLWQGRCHDVGSGYRRVSLGAQRMKQGSVALGLQFVILLAHAELRLLSHAL